MPSAQLPVSDTRILVRDPAWARTEVVAPVEVLRVSRVTAVLPSDVFMVSADPIWSVFRLLTLPLDPDWSRGSATPPPRREAGTADSRDLSELKLGNRLTAREANPEGKEEDF